MQVFVTHIGTSKTLLSRPELPPTHMTRSGGDGGSHQQVPTAIGETREEGHRGAATVQTEQNNPFGLYRFDRFE